MNREDGYVEHVDENGNIITDMLFTYDEDEKQQNEINKANAELIEDLTYLTVPMEIFNMGYSGHEVFILAHIHSFLGSKNKRYFFTNDQLSKRFNISVNTVSTIIKRLENDNQICVKRKMKANGGQIRFIDLATTRNLKLQLQKIGSSNSQKLVRSNNNIINNKISNNKKKEAVADTESVTLVQEQEYIQLTDTQREQSLSIAESFIGMYLQRFPTLPENKRRNKEAYARDIATIMFMYQHSAAEIMNTLLYVFENDFWVSRIKNSAMFLKSYEQIHHQMITQKTKVPL